MIEKLKIIDLSTVLAGPSVATFFAELGADVLKIEDINHSDVTKTWRIKDEKETAISSYFSSVNYGKKYQVLDFKRKTDLEKIYTHIKEADIVISNFRDIVARKLRLDKTSLFAVNPKLILGKILGFSSDENRPAYDMILQAECGYLSMTGTKQSGPQKMPVAMIDVLAAHQLKEGILIALLERQNNPKFSSKEVVVHLDKVGIASLINQASNYLMSGYIPRELGNEHPNIAPYGELFLSSDGISFTLAIGTDLHFSKLWEYLFSTEIPDCYLSNGKRVANRKELFKLLKERCIQLEFRDLSRFCMNENIPFGEIKTLDKVLNSDQAKEMTRSEEISGVNTKRITSIAFDIKNGKNYHD